LYADTVPMLYGTITRHGWRWSGRERMRQLGQKQQ
jgi:hypothetical protein